MPVALPDTMETSTIETFTAPEEANGSRLDTFLARRQSERSRTFFQQLIKDGRVLVNGKVAARSLVLEGGEEISVDLPPAEDPWPQAQDLPIDVLHQDDHVIVVNKAPGMIVHPAAGNPDGTLVNALLHHFPDLPGINGVKRPGIVHRLDRDTSGAMVVAKNDRAMKILSNAIKERTVSRLYIALVIGDPDWDEHTVEASIGRHHTLRHKRAVNGVAAKEAVTHFRVLARSNGFSLLRCQLESGRTHQIRVHASHVGLPIAGDWLYGGMEERMMERLRHADSQLRKAFSGLDRPFLHARLLKFRHPDDGEWRTFVAPLAPDLRKVAETLFAGLDLDAVIEAAFE